MAFNSLVERIHIGKTGSAFIVNSAGDYQTRPRAELVPDMNSLLEEYAVGQDEGAGKRHACFTPVRVIKTFSSGRNVASGIVRNQNGNIICILMPLKAGDWTLAYEQGRR